MGILIREIGSGKIGNARKALCSGKSLKFLQRGTILGNLSFKTQFIRQRDFPASIRLALQCRPLLAFVREGEALVKASALALALGLIPGNHEDACKCL